MAQALKNFDAGKRFGTRYGRKLRHKFIAVETQQKAEYVCPSCRYPKVKRVAVGIWECKKCDAKFAARAYSAEIKKKSVETASKQFGLSEEMIQKAEAKAESMQKKREEQRLAREEAKRLKAEQSEELLEGEALDEETIMPVSEEDEEEQ